MGDGAIGGTMDVKLVEHGLKLCCQDGTIFGARARTFDQAPEAGASVRGAL